jgi:hypothetical protein
MHSKIVIDCHMIVLLYLSMNTQNDSTKSVGLNIGHSRIFLNEIILESVGVGNPHVTNVILTLPCHTNHPLPVLHEVIPTEMKEHCRSNHVKGFLSDSGQSHLHLDGQLLESRANPVTSITSVQSDLRQRS